MVPRRSGTMIIQSTWLRALALTTIALFARSQAMSQTSSSGAQPQEGPRVVVRGLMSQASRFEAGLQVGPSVGWLRGNKAIDATDPMLGLSVAATLRYAFSERLGLRAGLGYQQKGTLVEMTLTDVEGNVLREVKSRNEMDYVLMPVLVQASFGNKARLLVGVGPYAGVLLRSRQSFGDESAFPTQDNTEDLEQWDMGISASLGGAFPLGEALSIQIEVRYDKGLTNISALPVVDDGSIRTNAVCLLVGCSYRFGSAL